MVAFDDSVAGVGCASQQQIAAPLRQHAHVGHVGNRLVPQIRRRRDFQHEIARAEFDEVLQTFVQDLLRDAQPDFVFRVDDAVRGEPLENAADRKF